MFEWPKFDVKHQGVFEEFAQQVNNAVGYTLSEVTLRGLSEPDDGGLIPSAFQNEPLGGGTDRKMHQDVGNLQQDYGRQKNKYKYIHLYIYSSTHVHSIV